MILLTSYMTEWREVPSHPGYLVSDDGQVIGKRGGLLKQSPNFWGYPCVGIGGSVTVHVLVCEAFHGPKPTPKHEVAHWDGDPENNNASNLRWATHKENCRDNTRLAAGLTLSQVEEIKDLIAAGSGRTVIARRYGVTPYVVHILTR